MARFKYAVQSRQDAECILSGRQCVRVGHNTTLERRGEDIAVRYHYTDVVTYRPNGTIELRTGGWHTPTTMDRLNSFAPVQVYQDRFAWYIGQNGSRVEFYDGILVDPDGTVA